MDSESSGQVASKSFETLPRWRDPALPVSDRVEALLAEMTLAEKVGQLGSRWVGNDTAPGVEADKRAAEDGGLPVAPIPAEFSSAGRTALAEAGRCGLGQLTRVYGSRPVTVEDGTAQLAPNRYRFPLDSLEFDHRPHGPPDYVAALAWCDRECVNPVAATGQAARIGDHVTAWQLPWAMFGYFHIRRRWADRLATTGIGLASARHIQDRVGEAAMLTILGHAHYYPRRFAQALSCYEHALAIRRDLADPIGETVLLNGIANVCLEPRARRHAEQSLLINQEIGNRRVVVFTLCSLARTLAATGNLADALRHFDDALTLSRQLDDRQAQAWTLNYLGFALLQADRAVEGAHHLRLAVELFRQLDDPQATDLLAPLAELDLTDPGLA